MLNLDNLKALLPPHPSYYGAWGAVYFEPMIASGERLTVIVAALGKDKDVCVRPAIRPHVIDAMFGCQAEAFSKLIAIACSSLEKHLREHDTFSGWTPPMSGMTIGRIRETASADIKGLLRQAVTMTASLAALDLDTDTDTTELVPASVDSWPEQFKNEVLKQNPDFSNCFNQKFSLNANARPARVFFLNQNVAINTGKLVPGRALSEMLRSNKASMMDLLGFRDISNQLVKSESFEHIILRPEPNSPLYSPKQNEAVAQAIETLESTGREYALKISVVESLKSAAQRLIAAAA